MAAPGVKYSRVPPCRHTWMSEPIGQQSERFAHFSGRKETAISPQSTRRTRREKEEGKQRIR